MGDIADAMIGGTLCQGCGVYIGAGFPSFCGSCKPPDAKAGGAQGGSPVGKKQLKRLSFCRDLTDNPSGMYPGDHLDRAPAIYGTLLNRGMVEVYTPHNPSHSERVVITEKGRRALL